MMYCVSAQYRANHKPKAHINMMDVSRLPKNKKQKVGSITGFDIWFTEMDQAIKFENQINKELISINKISRLVCDK